MEITEVPQTVFYHCGFDPLGFILTMSASNQCKH